jgi:hypothetical protein
MQILNKIILFKKLTNNKVQKIVLLLMVLDLRVVRIPQQIEVP